MNTFPYTRNNTMKSPSSLSPRQVANRAYSLALKKLDRDQKRRKPQYSVRERLLLAHTISRAEDLLNKGNTRSNRDILNVHHDGDILPPREHIPPPSPVILMEKPEIKETQAFPVQPHQIKQDESPIMMPTPEQIAAVSLVVVAAAYNTLNEQQIQQQSLINRDCRLVMIPHLHSMASLTTII